jgi:hypothetical protein
MLILDACRDNPFARSFRSSSRGLAQMDSPLGTLIAYSTSPGKTAADGSGRNGIYTNHLLTHIRTSNLEVGQMLRVVRSKVRRETNGKQVPWESTSLEGSFYFSTGAGPQQVDQVAKPEITKPQIKPDVQPTLSGIQLRSSYQTLGKNDVGSMLKKRGFFSKNYGWNSSWCNPGGDFKNQYESKIINRDKVVIDHTTGLMWHQSGSSDGMVSEKAEQWIRDLNNSEYAGYKDWRLPTLEEGASLLENSKQNGNLYIDPVFSKRQTWIWTGDKFDPGAAWVVDFVEGNVYGSDLDGRNCVRPVRPEQ